MNLPESLSQYSSTYLVGKGGNSKKCTSKIKSEEALLNNTLEFEDVDFCPSRVKLENEKYDEHQFDNGKNGTDGIEFVNLNNVTNTEKSHQFVKNELVQYVKDEMVEESYEHLAADYGISDVEDNKVKCESPEDGGEMSVGEHQDKEEHREREQELLQHLRDENIDDYVSPFHYALSDKNSFKIETTKESECQHKCEVCERTFKTKTNLMRHERMHNNQHPYPCEFCGKLFRKKCHLQRHNLIHTGERPFACDLCDARYRHKFDVQDHMRRMHGKTHNQKVPNVQCQVCCKTFYYKSNLKMHERTHTQERPFMCAICGMRFKQNCTMIKHMTVHDKANKQKLQPECKLACPVCGKAFLNKYRLDRHALIHTGERPFECEVCHKCFRQENSLTKHVVNVHYNSDPAVTSQVTVVHAGGDKAATQLEALALASVERVLKCGVCGRSFSGKYDLLRHERTHTDERPFACEVCGRTFRQKYGMTTHAKKMHGELK